MSAIFITGTDTGCGKTAIGCALARGLGAAGLRVRVLKPVETGCELRGEALVPADALALARAAGDDAPLERLCPYRLRLPAAPLVAAREEGVELKLEPIAEALAHARRDADAVIVEGAGGLLVPLAADLDFAQLAQRLALPVLIAARARLGTINHTLLTLEAARTRGLSVVGVAVSHVEPRLSAADRSNLDALLERLPVPFLGELRHGAERLDPEPAWETILSASDGS